MKVHDLVPVVYFSVLVESIPTHILSSNHS